MSPTLCQALREAWHDYEADGVVSVMAEWKASFWLEEYDVYTDTRAWRHKWVLAPFAGGRCFSPILRGMRTKRAVARHDLLPPKLGRMQCADGCQ